MSYTIAAIPTVYRGRKYRSRLEARWAAFFDLLGWKHEYEPYDLGKWSPDFLLTGKTVEGFDTSTLVEVKPHTAFDPDVAAKMADACTERGREDELLLLNVAPILEKGWVQLGYVLCRAPISRPPEWKPASLAWIRNTYTPGFKTDIVYDWQTDEFDYWSSVLSNDGHSYTGMLAPYGEHAMGLWARASNEVQWKGPDA